ncbi:MAG: hypothetical protein AB1467_00970 [Candidatus Diapherotrites archaeon]
MAREKYRKETKKENSLKEKYNKLKKKLSFLKWIDPFTYIEIALRRIHPKKARPSAMDETIDWAVYLISAFVIAWLLYTLLGVVLGTNYPMVIVLSGSMEPLTYRGDVMVLVGANHENVKAQEIDLSSIDLKGKQLQDIASVSPAQYQVQVILNQLGAMPQTTKELTFFDINKTIQLNTKGDIIVYYSALKQEQIIHRVIAKIKAKDGYYFLTKGDSTKNYWVDQDCQQLTYKSYILRNQNSCITLYPINESELQGKVLFKIPWLGWVKLIPFDEIPRLLTGRQQ